MGGQGLPPDGIHGAHDLKYNNLSMQCMRLFHLTRYELFSSESLVHPFAASLWFCMPKLGQLSERRTTQGDLRLTPGSFTLHPMGTLSQNGFRIRIQILYARFTGR